MNREEKEANNSVTMGITQSPSAKRIVAKTQWAPHLHAVNERPKIAGAIIQAFKHTNNLTCT